MFLGEYFHRSLGYAGISLKPALEKRQGHAEQREAPGPGCNGTKWGVFFFGMNGISWSSWGVLLNCCRLALAGLCLQWERAGWSWWRAGRASQSVHNPQESPQTRQEATKKGLGWAGLFLCVGLWSVPLWQGYLEHRSQSKPTEFFPEDLRVRRNGHIPLGLARPRVRAPA